MTNQNQIQEILEEASAVGVKKEVKKLALGLIEAYEKFLAKKFPGGEYGASEEEKFYELAYHMLVEEDEKDEEDSSKGYKAASDHQMQHDSNIVAYGNSYRLYAHSEEYFHRLAAVAEEISIKDERINTNRINQKQDLIENVFIVTDIWALYTYYELVYALETYDSPKLILSTDLKSELDMMPTDANIYILSYHKTDNSERIARELISRKIINSDITIIEVLGQHSMKPCQTIPIISIKDRNILVDCYGLGRPDRNGKYSEVIGIYS